MLTSSGKPTFRDTDAQWDALHAALPEALRMAEGMLRETDLTALMEDRFRHGEAEFGDAWLHRPPDWFTREAREEAADLLIYLAMRVVRGG